MTQHEAPPKRSGTDLENASRRLDEINGLIDEDGWMADYQQELLVLLALARRQALGWAALEERIKGVKKDIDGPLWTAYQAGLIAKTTTLKDVVKIQFRDAGKPKVETIAAHYDLDVEAFWDEFEPTSFPTLIEKGIVKWVPRQKIEKDGAPAGMSVSLLEG